MTYSNLSKITTSTTAGPWREPGDSSRGNRSGLRWARPGSEGREQAGNERPASSLDAIPAGRLLRTRIKTH